LNCLAFYARKDFDQLILVIRLAAKRLEESVANRDGKCWIAAAYFLRSLMPFTDGKSGI